jgi:hypothetical protein
MSQAERGGPEPVAAPLDLAPTIPGAAARMWRAPRIGGCWPGSHGDRVRYPLAPRTVKP